MCSCPHSAQPRSQTWACMACRCLLCMPHPWTSITASLSAASALPCIAVCHRPWSWLPSAQSAAADPTTRALCALPLPCPLLGIASPLPPPCLPAPRPLPDGPGQQPGPPDGRPPMHHAAGRAHSGAGAVLAPVGRAGGVPPRARGAEGRHLVLRHPHLRAGAQLSRACQQDEAVAGATPALSAASQALLCVAGAGALSRQQLPPVSTTRYEDVHGGCSWSACTSLLAAAVHSFLRPSGQAETRCGLSTRCLCRQRLRTLPDTRPSASPARFRYAPMAVHQFVPHLQAASRGHMQPFSRHMDRGWAGSPSAR